jgi:uncharacterized DUF497 family protein
MKRAFVLGLAMALVAHTLTQAEEPALPVPETIRVQGVPPIPASVRKALNRYQNIRSASFQDWASDGSGMYIITRFADVPQVHFVAQAGGARTQLTFLPERVLSVSARPKHDQFLYMIDEAKAAKNLKKHGVSFRDAAIVLADAAGDFYHVEEFDEEHSEDEDRYITTASHPDNRRTILSITWTHRFTGGVRKTRIISARPVTLLERKNYAKEIGQK